MSGPPRCALRRLALDLHRPRITALDNAENEWLGGSKYSSDAQDSLVLVSTVKSSSSEDRLSLLFEARFWVPRPAGYLPEKDARTAEVPRMIVSATYRRRGVGVRLIPALRCIELYTSESGAQRLYERLGWVVVRVDTLWAGIVRLEQRYFRRPVGAP
ncbi:hypothetical protein B0H17DRAFT_1201945 [Mycena rosella]|uniref:N-acetyltransferase domain-containing protein n=1 Tax=Mycena rosella TaxID=1033263 RepID=A0AAD7GDX5_MYCRO|nr:hypothetical protein B0H17DRAFT_1201945 [Mycena rosella]